MIALVTGATGLLGTHVMLELLSQGIAVRGMYRPWSDRKTVRDVFAFYRSEGLYSSIEWVEGDVEDVTLLQEAMAGCDVVYHCAAIVSYHRSDRKRMYHINIEGTANVVNVALALHVKHLCHVSSIAAIGRMHNGQHLTENDEWAESPLNTHYGITKYLSEMEVWRGIQEGLPAVIVNPGLIFGPGDSRRSSTSIFSKLDEGIPAYPPGGTGFVGVTDVARIMVKLVQQGITNERYIVVSDNRSMAEVFSEVSRCLGKPVQTRIATPSLLFIGRVVETIKEWLTRKKALVTRETTRNAQLRFYFDSSKVKKALNYTFEPLQQSIEQGAAFYKNQR
jgi:dihydroflavonol-4-reductase